MYSLAIVWIPSCVTVGEEPPLEELLGAGVIVLEELELELDPVTGALELE